MMRAWLGLVILGACLGVVRPAWAWLTLSVQADNVLVELSRDGSAVVAHELLIKVRGGPLKQFSIAGVDPDAVPSGDATIVRAKSGREAGIPIALIAAGDSEGLRFGVSYEKGLPSGSYLVRFSYKTELQARDRIGQNGPRAVVSWTGPQFADGLDLLQTTFVVPRAELAPRQLGGSDADPQAMVAREEGVFLSELHRGADLDRLTLSRPHAAKGERVNWQLEVDARLFSGLSTHVVKEAPMPLPPPVAEPSRMPESPWRHWGWIALAAVLVPLLAHAKHWGARTTFVLPLGPLSKLRPLLSFAALAGSLLLALDFGATTWAGALLCSCMLLTLQKPSLAPQAARGPGRWQDVQFDTLEFAEPPRIGRAQWLDAGSLKGLSLFLLASLGFMVLGLRLLGASPYHSAMTLVYSTMLVPLFFSLGSLSAKSPVEEQRDFLRRLGLRLRKWRNVTQIERGRFALGSQEPDELRLSLALAVTRSGLLGIEVGVGFANASLKRIALPVVIVRAREGSAAHRALPRDAEWSRGRDPEERVALIRPALPLLASTAETLRDVCQCLREKPRKDAPATSVKATSAKTTAKGAASKGTAVRAADPHRAGQRSAAAQAGDAKNDAATRREPKPRTRTFGAPKPGAVPV